MPSGRRPDTMLQTVLGVLPPMKKQRHPAGIWLARTVCLGSWAAVTVLLLVPNPAALVGLRHAPRPGYALLAHLGSFFLLSVLTLASRLPVSWPATLGVLVSYGAVVELLQGFVPRRTVAFADFVANTVGIVLGAAAYACATWYWRRRSRNARNA